MHWIIHRIHNSVRICDIEPGQPHRLRTFKRSRDPSFPAKLADIVGLYVDPPARAAVLSLDEKSQIQALDRTQPGLPIKYTKFRMPQLATIMVLISLILNLSNERLHFHWNRLIESVNPARPAVQQFLDTQADRLDPLLSGDPNRAALKMLAAVVQREALVLTFNDVILLLGTLFVIGLMLMPLVGRPRAATGGGH